jgi:hypothetical protein
MSARAIACGVILLTLTACNQQSSANLDAQSAKIAELEKKVVGLQENIFFLLTNRPKFASVNTTDSNFGVSYSQIGPFTVAVEHAEKYLDGYRIRLRVGNLTSATATSPKLVVGWGSTPENWKKKEFDLPDKFFAGAFNRATVTISPASSEDIKQISVAVEIGGVEMRKMYQ